MNIKHMNDTGLRHEWRCENGDCTYVVSYNYGDDKSWTVQRLREDGLREVLSMGEAKEILGKFPAELRLAPRLLESEQSETGAGTR